jgi:hypothetical protein
LEAIVSGQWCDRCHGFVEVCCSYCGYCFGCCNCDDDAEFDSDEASNDENYSLKENYCDSKNSIQQMQPKTNGASIGLASDVV